MAAYSHTLESLKSSPRSWLITGAAGFIGSHLLETLLGLGQRVTGLDDFSTGSRANLDEVRARVAAGAWQNFHFIEGTIHDPATCRDAARGADFILHEAAFISVPLSLEDPDACNRTNIGGFENILAAAVENNVKRVVHASSSAVYGSDTTMPKVEQKTGRPLSPYAASKFQNEIQARAALRDHGLGVVGLRYFN
ncbi:MAG TPA: NAD-dependent epimerase/dehydratase family protein, partial [Chthoniobacteraceae bacterium]|nr:NAD-dependent epimerase/dehydratase family protein [Chthoniobacteraceae bacterium]